MAVYGSYLRSGGLECSKNRSILATHRSYGRDCIAESALQSRAKIYRHYPSGKRLLDGQLLNIVEEVEKLQDGISILDHSSL